MKLTAFFDFDFDASLSAFSLNARGGPLSKSSCMRRVGKLGGWMLVWARSRTTGGGGGCGSARKGIVDDASESQLASRFIVRRIVDDVSESQLVSCFIVRRR